jgi:hypothetical protein
MKNKIIFSGFFYLILLLPSFAQSKRDQIQSLQLSLDSFSKALIIEKNMVDELKNQLIEKSNSLRQKETEYLFVVEQWNEQNKKYNSLLLEISRLKDSVDFCRKSINDLTSTRDLSNGVFSNEELKFISQFFLRKLSYCFDDVTDPKVLIQPSKIIVHSEGEIGNVPAFDFEKKYNPLFSGDLDKDGTKEILFQVNTTGGGTAEWTDLYCLKIFPNNNYLIFDVNVPCGCGGNFDCRTPNSEIIDIKGNVLTIENRCFESSDPDCCPSSIRRAKYQFVNTSLLLMN